jgi:hypothetical protein
MTKDEILELIRNEEAELVLSALRATRDVRCQR